MSVPLLAFALCFVRFVDATPLALRRVVPVCYDNDNDPIQCPSDFNKTRGIIIAALVATVVVLLIIGYVVKRRREQQLWVKPLRARGSVLPPVETLPYQSEVEPQKRGGETIYPYRVGDSETTLAVPPPAYKV